MKKIQSGIHNIFQELYGYLQHRETIQFIFVKANFLINHETFTCVHLCYIRFISIQFLFTPFKKRKKSNNFAIFLTFAIGKLQLKLLIQSSKVTYLLRKFRYFFLLDTKISIKFPSVLCSKKLHSSSCV